MSKIRRPNRRETLESFSVRSALAVAPARVDKAPSFGGMVSWLWIVKGCLREEGVSKALGNSQEVGGHFRDQKVRSPCGASLSAC